MPILIHRPPSIIHHPSSISCSLISHLDHCSKATMVSCCGGEVESPSKSNANPNPNQPTTSKPSAVAIPHKKKHTKEFPIRSKEKTVMKKDVETQCQVDVSHVEIQTDNDPSSPSSHSLSFVKGSPSIARLQQSKPSVVDNLLASSARRGPSPSLMNTNSYFSSGSFNNDNNNNNNNINSGSSYNTKINNNDNPNRRNSDIVSPRFDFGPSRRSASLDSAPVNVQDMLHQYKFQELQSVNALSKVGAMKQVNQFNGQSMLVSNQPLHAPGDGSVSSGTVLPDEESYEIQLPSVFSKSASYINDVNFRERESSNARLAVSHQLPSYDNSPSDDAYNSRARDNGGMRLSGSPPSHASTPRSERALSNLGSHGMADSPTMLNPNRSRNSMLDSTGIHSPPQFLRKSSYLPDNLLHELSPTVKAKPGLFESYSNSDIAMESDKTVATYESEPNLQDAKTVNQRRLSKEGTPAPLLSRRTSNGSVTDLTRRSSSGSVTELGLGRRTSDGSMSSSHSSVRRSSATAPHINSKKLNILSGAEKQLNSYNNMVSTLNGKETDDALVTKSIILSPKQISISSSTQISPLSSISSSPKVLLTDTYQPLTGHINNYGTAANKNHSPGSPLQALSSKLKPVVNSDMFDDDDSFSSDVCSDADDGDDNINVVPGKHQSIQNSLPLTALSPKARLSPPKPVSSGTNHSNVTASNKHDAGRSRKSSSSSNRTKLKRRSSKDSIE